MQVTVAEAGARRRPGRNSSGDSNVPAGLSPGKSLGLGVGDALAGRPGLAGWAERWAATSLPRTRRRCPLAGGNQQEEGKQKGEKQQNRRS